MLGQSHMAVGITSSDVDVLVHEQILLVDLLNGLVIIFNDKVAAIFLCTKVLTSKHHS